MLCSGERHRDRRLGAGTERVPGASLVAHLPVFSAAFVSLSFFCRGHRRIRASLGIAVVWSSCGIGALRDGYAPVLAITSDQASTMFAAANFLSYQCGLRLVWYPDVNHVEHNVERHVMVAAGLAQVNEKVTFLSRLPHGPQRDAGHWFCQTREAFMAPTCISPPAIRTRWLVCCCWDGYDGYSSRCCRAALLILCLSRFSVRLGQLGTVLWCSFKWAWAELGGASPFHFGLDGAQGVLRLVCASHSIVPLPYERVPPLAFSVARAQAFQEEVRSGNESVLKFFDLYLPGICSDLCLGNPDDPQTREAACLGLSSCALWFGAPLNLLT